MGRYLLFARPSFLSGVSTVLDLYQVSWEYNTCLTEDQADFFALQSDWEAVGGDIKAAMGKFIAEADSHGKEQAK